MLALRVLILTEFRIRQALIQTHSALAGLNWAVPSQPATQPTVDRVLAVFRNLHLTLIQLPNHTIRYVTPLSRLQQQILKLLGIKDSLYARLARAAP